MMQQHGVNHFVFGKIGNGQKMIIFKEEMFNQEFVPSHAKIERFTEKGVNLVRMTEKIKKNNKKQLKH